MSKVRNSKTKMDSKKEMKAVLINKSQSYYIYQNQYQECQIHEIFFWHCQVR